VEKGFLQSFKRPVFYCFFVLFVFAVFFACCYATRATVDKSVLEHQRRIAELENRVTDYERRLGEYDSLIRGTKQRLEAIRTRADSFADRVDRITFLFDEYEREVQRIIDESAAIRADPTEKPEG
jgi:chromosome segregation ATPase